MKLIHIVFPPISSLYEICSSATDIPKHLAGWIVGLWVMLSLIMEQWLLGGKIQSEVVNNIESEEHSSL